MVVVLGERNKGMDGMNSLAGDHSRRVSRFGKKGFLMARNCRTEKASEGGTPRALHSIFRILRAYFRKRVHSIAVGSLLKDFQNREGKTHVVGPLTMNPPPSQTSPGNDLNNGSNLFWVPHKASNTGSSRLLQQHANATDVAFPPDATSSPATSLTISSTQRQGCIGSRGILNRTLEVRRKSATYG